MIRWIFVSDLSEKCTPAAIKRSYYDSLYSRNILLGEEVLLQPFKVFISPIHMKLSCSRQLQQPVERESNAHSENKSSLKQINVFRTFWDTIIKVSESPSCSTSVTLMLWTWTLKNEDASFTSSCRKKYVSNRCLQRSSKGKKEHTWIFSGSHDAHTFSKQTAGLTIMVNLSSFQFTLKKVLLSFYFSKIASFVSFFALQLQLLRRHRISFGSKCTVHLGEAG